ncbi:hypothetical protein [Streptomyces sp. NPDC088812]|uniref:hypothetical protein n=1 Tax=Streptomyces sp. NPDC088812 TaxID=3365905 RepID=UPI003811293D
MREGDQVPRRPGPGGLNDVRNSVPHFAQPTLAGVEPSKLAGPDLVVTLRQYAQ